MWHYSLHWTRLRCGPLGMKTRLKMFRYETKCNASSRQRPHKIVFIFRQINNHAIRANANVNGLKDRPQCRCRQIRFRTANCSFHLNFTNPRQSVQRIREAGTSFNRITCYRLRLRVHPESSPTASPLQVCSQERQRNYAGAHTIVIRILCARPECGTLSYRSGTWYKLYNTMLATKTVTATP